MRIQFLPTLIIAALLFFAAACNESKKEENGDIRSRKFEIAGVSVTAPDDTGWELLNSSASAISFMRQSDSTVTAVNVTLLPAQEFKSDQDFLMFYEEFMNKRWNPLVMQSVHFNRVKFHDEAGLQYDGIFRDSMAAGSEKEFLSTRGLICRHPENKSYVLHVDMTHHAADKSISEKTIETFQKLVEALSFTNNGFGAAQKNPHENLQ